MDKILGLHHVTAIVSDPQRNVDFYAGVLGQRLIKKTINFDDPGTYHLYYGDEQGHPGTLITFFPWNQAPKGSKGTGEVSETSYAIPMDALDYWQDRLHQQNVPFTGPVSVFDEQVITFKDPDDLVIRLIAKAGVEQRQGWIDGPIPDQYAIRGIHGVTLTVADPAGTDLMLSEVLGFQKRDQFKERTRYAIGENEAQSLIEVQGLPGVNRGRIAVGSVHHVAWRTPTDEDQIQWRERLIQLRRDVTPVLDRNYFHSIYFHEPGGILFEIATDPPGFTVDEPLKELGTHLMLPAWLEEQRSVLEKTLQPLHLPYGEVK